MRLNNTRIDKITMIAGPVGNFGTDVLQIVPPMADIMPKNPANIHMVPSLFRPLSCPNGGCNEEGANQDSPYRLNADNDGHDQ